VNVGTTLFGQLMEFVPWTSFARIMQRYAGDSGVRRLSCAEQFRVMAFAQLTWRESLRDVEASLSATPRGCCAYCPHDPRAVESLAPFAVAYGQDLLKDALIIDIGGGTIDFCIMHGAVPNEDDQRTLSTAGDYLDEKLLEALRERYPKSNITLNMARQFKEQFSFVGEMDDAAQVDIPVDGKATQHDIGKELRTTCESILPSVIETAAEMISRLDPEYQDPVRSNIVLAGGGSQIRGLAQYIEREMRAYGPCQVKCIEDVLYAGAEGCLALAKDMPHEYWEAMAA
jgi:actin-related protein